MATRRAARERAFFRILVVLIALLLLLCLVAAIALGVLKLLPQHGDAPTEDTPQENEGEETPDDPTPPSQDTPVGPVDGEQTVLLGRSVDMGQAYIDKMIFLGESTTAHLLARKVLTGGRDSKQVWKGENATLTLSPEILKRTILYPDTGEYITIEDAVARKQPEYLVLSFGVNGLTNFAGNRNLYATSYAKLIGAIKAKSPDTVIILQTVYPVGASPEGFSKDGVTLNGYIDTLNEWLLDIAKQNGVYVVDTASALKDADGLLASAYDTGDGIHLTVAAYDVILQYLRTHGVQ